MKTIPFFRSSTPLTPAERLAKRHLVFKDTLALLSVFAVTCVLAVLTWLIFRSYSQHQRDAAARWKRRGEEALVHNNPAAAVYDLRTSLGYEPDHRDTEVKLAQALAQMGTPRSMQEAAVYFNTLVGEGAGRRQHQPATGSAVRRARDSWRRLWTTITRRFMGSGRAMAPSGGGRCGWSWSATSSNRSGLTTPGTSC